MSDDRTLAVYAEAAARYADRFAGEDMAEQADDLARFVGRLPAGGRVLDLGCGPGHWAARLRDAGFAVDAIDASPEMAALAAEQFGLEVRVAGFETLSAQRHYDGVWANFSLLHAPRAAFPGHLERIARALRPGGTLLLGMKLGQGEGRDHLGRFYSYYAEDELRRLLEAAGLSPFHTRSGHGTGLAGTDDPFAVILAHA